MTRTATAPTRHIIIVRCGAHDGSGRRCETTERLVLDPVVTVPYANGTTGAETARRGAGYLLQCVEHGRPSSYNGNTMRDIREIRARFSNAPCSDACTRSEGGDCRCRCGGSFHGVDA